MDWLKNKLANLNIDFVGKRRPFAVLSITLVLLSWFVFLIYPGPQWGIDFEGGTELHVKFGVNAEGEVNEGIEPVTIDSLRDTLKGMEFGDDVVQRVGVPEDQEYQIRIKDTTEGSEELQGQVRDALEKKFGDGWIKEPGGWTTDAEVGTRVDVNYTGDDVPVNQVAAALAGIDGVSVSEGKELKTMSVRLPGIAQIIQRELNKQYPDNMQVLVSDSVGPKVGGDLATQGFIAIVITLGLVLVYIAFRFDIGFAPGAVLALVHDVSLTAGVFVAMGLEFNLPIVGALLTIVGYSLNDTIVIYDRIRENSDRYRRKEVADLINVSVNETMARTLATSVTTFLAILPFLFMGGETIQAFIPGLPSAGNVIWSFAFAMLLGIVFGTYSTIYVASPTILVMQDVKPWLMRMVAIPGLSNPDDDQDDDAEVPDGAMTASEQRRRERAERAGPE